MRYIELDKAVLEDELKSKSIEKLALELGVGKQTVIRRCKEYGIEIPAKNKSRKSYANILTRDYLESVKDTHTYKDIMAEIGCKKSVIFKYCSKYGVALKSPDMPSGEDNHNWKGGYTTVRKYNGSGKGHNSYIKRNSDGKYLHRIVMEEHLGRELLTTEDVHHIDGNGLNNDINNLVVLDKTIHSKFHNLLSALNIDHRTLTKEQVTMLACEEGLNVLREKVLDFVR